MKNDRARQARARQPVKLLCTILVAADQARDSQPRDVRAHAERISAVARQRRRAGNADHHQGNSRHPPEAKLPSHAAAVDDEIGIKRHGFFSSLLRFVFFVFFVLFVVFALALAFERRSENVAQGGAGIR